MGGLDVVEQAVINMLNAKTIHCLFISMMGFFIYEYVYEPCWVDLGLFV